MMDMIKSYWDKFLRIDEIKKFVWGIYFLQFMALFTAGLSFLISGFLAYLKHDESIGTVAQSHFSWQIKTFWVVLAGLLSGILLLVILIGKLILFVTQLWLFYRVIKGSYYYSQNRAIENNGFF